MSEAAAETSKVHSPQNGKQFRLKDPHRSSRHEDRKHDTEDPQRRSHRHHHTSHHRRKRRRTSEDKTQEPLPRDATEGLDPDRAFQESLFDALGDDEGADFWHGVYGQPIHNYQNTHINEETGELEQMDEEAYAQYVRRRMWEKSREGIETAREEERQRKVEEERRKKDNPEFPSDKAAYNNFAFDFEIEASLRRGQKRKDRKRWRDLWEDYLKKWDELKTLAASRDTEKGTTNLFLRNKIAWPVETGKRQDVTAEQIEKFITLGVGSAPQDQDNSVLVTALKQERVRWHPDKVQQRYGFMQIDELTIQGVTATFQVFDRMWNDLKRRKS